VNRRLRYALILAAALPPSAILWAALGPFASGDRNQVFEIPQGTWARRMAGDKVGILPNDVRLTLGVRDVLVLKNRDDVPQVFGPVLMMPGQSFSLPFEMASTYRFACTAHASGQMTVTVEPTPELGWERLAWRTRELMASRGWI